MNHQYIQLGGESAQGQTSQRANKPKGESAWHRGRTGQGVNQQRGEKATIQYDHCVTTV